MIAWEYLVYLVNHVYIGLQSIERPGRPSNSEIKRWFQNNAVEINGYKVQWDEELSYYIQSLVLFPNGKRRITLL